MGAKDSKRSCLSYEDAVKRVSDQELKRVCEAFKRLTNGGQLLSRAAFVQNVLGDGVPATIADWLYNACGGGAKGIALRDLICGLVLLTKGTQEEKIRFLWTLYSNDSGTYVSKAEFQCRLQEEGVVPKVSWDRTLISLFGVGQDKAGFEEFRAWIGYNTEATVLSAWLLSHPCVSLSSEVETPTFYQTLAGVTHLEEQDICELEKCFWAIQSGSATGHLDLNCLQSLVCPPVPQKTCRGLFLALDVNRDDHVDFKELCCGISAACRGPMVERMKFCFKIFDMDRDNYLSADEVQHMVETLRFIAQENKLTYASGHVITCPETPDRDEHSKTIDSLNVKIDSDGGLTQEDYLVWSVKNNSLLAPLLELLFQVCHVSLGLKPYCRHNEYEIVMGWLEREQRRGYYVGQFWYLISTEWWQNWVSYTTAPKTHGDHCNCRPQIEEGIVCDESLISNATDCTSPSISNEFNSNSMESMGDLLSRGDSCSIASSSGVSSSSAGSKRSHNVPGPIDNSNLVEESPYKVPTLTGEGGRLRRDRTLAQDRDFVLVPDSLWKALALWYGGPLPLPRQVIKPPGKNEVELELYPLNLRILRHQMQNQGGGSTGTWSSVVGGYGAAALSTAGLNASPVTAVQRRQLSHTAAFSRLATVQQVADFLCARLALRTEDARLWHLRDHASLLDDDNATLQDLGFRDSDQILIEVRNKDLTWPEEMGQLVASGGHELSVERRPTICLPPGATGLHNLGNTCFMNAALQAVSNTRPLTQYFQRDRQLSELNTSNPLGTKGVVARKYAELCNELWAGSTRSVAPLKLRVCVSKHAPHLGGGGQHDSQELLAWLLDALHEDLNRVTKKQYTELKDSGGRPDEIVAEEAWQQHLARDHSIITDLFYGQLKSKVTCQTCGHESVRFDAFNLLSLPLPMESYTLCEVLVVRLNGECPTKYGLRLNSEARYGELKEQLRHLSGIGAHRLLLAEVAYCQIKYVPSDEARINPNTATELYGYELPRNTSMAETEDGETDERETEADSGVGESPLGRVPENVKPTSQSNNKPESRLTNGAAFKKSSVSINSSNSTASGNSSDSNYKFPTYLVGVHRKCVRQETYFLSQQKSKPSLFGLPLLLGCSQTTTCQDLYQEVWGQVTRLLSPLPQSDQTNHAQDCDDSLGYEFPFTLKAVLQGGQICALCHWTQFCRGCALPCSEDELLFEKCKSAMLSGSNMHIAIDWDPTALHLRYQTNREKLSIEHESVATCRKLHTEPIDLDYCLRAFTSEERLEAKYHCSNCQDKQPATKKLQIWRLPPILIIHLKRFDYVNNKWVKTQKVVNFPFKDFDPTAYLASIPQETILRHRQLQENNATINELETSCDSQTTTTTNERIPEEQQSGGIDDVVSTTEKCKLLSDKPGNKATERVRGRARLESTSLQKTPVIDEHLKDYHQHKLNPGQDPFDLKYQLYAVVSHSGMLNGGHYISYACNPNGNWYCYNDSSCREVLTDAPDSGLGSRSSPYSGCTPLSRRKNIQRKHSTASSGNGTIETCSSPSFGRKETSTPNATRKNSLQSVKTPVLQRRDSNHKRESSSGIESNATSTENVSNVGDSEEKLMRESPYSSTRSLFKCPYAETRIPKIDTSTAYILFYERSGLDSRPYLPKIDPNAAQNVQVPDLEEDEALRKQQCSIQ
ncbi:ubiquitin carboxyl-terminal hydrolase 32 isoform X2 [Aethina tumida]|uniref:ubiquitin carboxyl-terminal hydrolase 32 isoform X2 n=1 Tax=Aethina tumida TaxID=116153 RepID=UPI0021480E11|nr:ubiquitin carboxyl-terminal hydrolase 32 isoform X2 [Aethina tumida]